MRGSPGGVDCRRVAARTDRGAHIAAATAGCTAVAARSECVAAHALCTATGGRTQLGGRSVRAPLDGGGSRRRAAPRCAIAQQRAVDDERGRLRRSARRADLGGAGRARRLDR